MNKFDDIADPIESFAKRKDRRKPKGKRSIKALKAAPKGAATSAKFEDANLQRLYERGHINELLMELQSGKEAAVYLAEGAKPDELVAVKIYSDVMVRSFKRDEVYRDGRYIGNDRLQKAMSQRSKTGVQAQQALWVMHEYSQLWALHNAGIPCPRPLVGPGLKDIAEAGNVVLMTYIGDRDTPAPRLSDVKLEQADAEDAFAQSLHIMTELLKIGKVHGDYSTFNLLWWEGRVYVIDFPQMVDTQENPSAWSLLERDVQSLCKSFKTLGVDADPRRVFQDVKAKAGVKQEFLKR